MSLLSPIREFVGFVLPFPEHVPIIRTILGFILVFFLPGFAWTLVFFRQINLLERITLSFGLSIAIVTLSLLLVNRLTGISVTGLNSALIIMGIIILPILIYFLNRLIRRGGSSDT